MSALNAARELLKNYDFIEDHAREHPGDTSIPHETEVEIWLEIIGRSLFTIADALEAESL